MTRTAPRAISSETMRKTLKVPCEGRKRRSDRDGKHILSTRNGKIESTRVNDSKQFSCYKMCFIQIEWWKSTFWERILLSRRTVRCRTTSVTYSLRKERKKINTRHKYRSWQLSQKPTTSKKMVKKKSFPEELPYNWHLKYANSLEAKLLLVQASTNSPWVKSKKTTQRKRSTR